MTIKELSFDNIRAGISSVFKEIPDSRQHSKVTVSIHDALMSGLACMFFQDSSLLQFQQHLQDAQHKNNLETLFDVKNIPKETQMRTIIDKINSEHFTGAFESIYSQLQQNKYLDQYELLPGLFLFPFDGTTYFSSGKVHCDKCLIKKRHTLSHIDLLSEIPEDIESFKSNTYILIHAKQKWRLIYIDEDQNKTDIEIGTVDSLNAILTDKTLTQLSTANSKKQLKKIIKKYHDNHCEHSTTYSHQALQGGIMHPNQKMIIPFMPEEVRNTDGKDKQDCEMNAAKRLVEKISKKHEGIIFCGDSLFSKQPLIEHILKNKNHYLFGVKLTDHKYLREWISNDPPLKKIKYIDEKGLQHSYEWINKVPLNSRADRIKVNLIRYKIIDKSSNIKYQNIWVTDIEITKENVKALVLGGRCRWKSENECFNVLKNHGYDLEHNYGHGAINLCFNFYLLTLLAFFIHQFLELNSSLYQAARKKFGSKKNMWNMLRSCIQMFVFDSWESLLKFVLNPSRYTITEAQGP